MYIMKKTFLLSLFLIIIGMLASSQTKIQGNESLRKIVLQLVPGNENPRNSEGDFITLKNGNILFVYSHFYGNSDSDFGMARLAGRISADNGKTWNKEDIPVVDNAKCTGCGACVSKCPIKVMTLL